MITGKKLGLHKGYKENVNLNVACIHRVSSQNKRFMIIVFNNNRGQLNQPLLLWYHYHPPNPTPIPSLVIFNQNIPCDSLRQVLILPAPFL
jgi:hypothetical protein